MRVPWRWPCRPASARAPPRRSVRVAWRSSTPGTTTRRAALQAPLRRLSSDVSAIAQIHRSGAVSLESTLARIPLSAPRVSEPPVSLLSSGERWTALRLEHLHTPPGELGEGYLSAHLVALLLSGPQMLQLMPAGGAWVTYRVEAGSVQHRSAAAPVRDAPADRARQGTARSNLALARRGGAAERVRQPEQLHHGVPAHRAAHSGRVPAGARAPIGQATFSLSALAKSRPDFEKPAENGKDPTPGRLAGMSALPPQGGAMTRRIPLLLVAVTIALAPRAQA